MSDENGEKRVFPIDAVIFDLIICGLFLTFSIVSLDYNPRARSIPLALGILGSVMMFIQFLVDALPSVRAKLQFVSSSGLLSDEDSPLKPKKDGKPITRELGETDDNASPSQEKQGPDLSDWWRVFRLILWLVGFIILLSLTNYLIAVGAFILLLTGVEAKESWKRAILLAFFVDSGFFILFELLLNAQL